MVIIHPHAKDRLLERGATESEIIETVERVKQYLRNLEGTVSGRILYSEECGMAGNIT